MKYEYRVRWRRDGRQATTTIYQTESAAQRKADGILGLEAVKSGTRFDDMPDLVEPPVIQRREVGEWEAAPEQITEPSDDAVARMEEFAVPGSQSDAYYGGPF